MNFALETQKLKKNILQHYYDQLNELERQKNRETSSAILLQKNIRMFLCYKRFKLLRSISLEIQRHFKGFLARTNHEKGIKGLSNNMNMQYFDYHAVILQKQCRKYVLDYSARKKYLEFVEKKNAETLTKLEVYSKRIQLERERKAEEDKRNKFNKICSNLHHLVGTKEIKGVYNVDPHSERSAKDSIVFNADVETHLKSVFKNNLKNSNFKQIK